MPRCGACLRRRGITARIVRRGVESSTRLGRHRWRVEGSLPWLSSNRSAKARRNAPDPADDGELLALRLGDRGPAVAHALGWVREFLDRLARLEELNRA